VFSHCGIFEILCFDKVRLPQRFVAKSRVSETGGKLQTKSSVQEMSPGGNLADKADTVEDRQKDIQLALRWIRQEIVCTS